MFGMNDVEVYFLSITVPDQAWRDVAALRVCDYQRELTSNLVFMIRASAGLQSSRAVLNP